MDNETLSALKGFDGVWDRVSGRPAPSLGELADAAERQRELLCALAGHCPQHAARLRTMAAAEAAAVCRLRAENFLAAGENYRPAAACALIKSALCALREAYLGASALADKLQEAANAAPCELRNTLDVLAAAERCRARELRALVLCGFGVNCS